MRPSRQSSKKTTSSSPSSPSRVRLGEVLFPTVADVLEAHAASLAAHGGLDGVRDPGLLESAVMSPRSGYYASLADLAAALLFGIARNHAFLDGNKRTAVVTAFAFLRVNGATIVAPTRETHAIVDGVAAGQITREQLGAYLTLLLGGDPRVFDELALPDAAAASDARSEGAAHRIDRRREPWLPHGNSGGSCEHHAMEWIAIRAKPRKSAAVKLSVDGSDLRPRTKETVPPGEIRLQDSVGLGGKSLRKEKTRHRVLAPWERHLIVDRALAEAIFAPLGPAVVNLRAAPVSDKKGLVDPDYVLVELLARVPLDRTASDADYSAGGAARGLLTTLRRATWSPARAPRVPVFRLLDRPEFVFVDATIAAALGDSIVPDDFEDAAYDQWLPTGYELPGLPPVAPGDDAASEAKGAEEAFWRAYAGSKKDRAATLTHPFWALATAIALDGGPADDTRLAASKAPILAARYAIEVDHQGHEVTRRGASTDGAAILYYAEEIDFTIAPAARELILAVGHHDEGTLAGVEARLAAKRATRDDGDGREGRAQAVAIAGPWPEELPPRYWEVGPATGTRTKTKARAKTKPKTPHVEALDDALRSDIDAFVLRGYARLELPPHDDARAAAPEEVVDRLFAAVARIQAGGEKLTAKTRATAAMELGCAWGEQLRRTLSWQWGYVHFEGGKGIALVSPDRTHCHFPLAMMQRHLAPKQQGNTLALWFNMATAAKLPAAEKGALVSVQ